MTGYGLDRDVTVVVESVRTTTAYYQIPGREATTFDGSLWVPMATTFDGSLWVPMEDTGDGGPHVSLQHELLPEEIVHFVRAGLNRKVDSIAFLVHVSASSVGMWTTPRFGSLTLSVHHDGRSPAVNMCGLVSELPERVARTVLSMQVMES